MATQLPRQIPGVTGTVEEQRFFNNLTANLTTSITAADTNLKLTNQNGDWPILLDEYQYITLTLTSYADPTKIEIIKVTNLLRDALVAQRGYDGTSAQDWAYDDCWVAGRVNALALDETARRDQENLFAAHIQLADGFSAAGDPNFIENETQLWADGEAVGSLTPLTQAVALTANYTMTIAAPTLRLNQIGWPSDPALLEAQHLAVLNGQIVGRPLGYYLGALPYPPLINNFGYTLQAGMYYFDTTTNAMRVFTGTVWENMFAPGPGWLAQWVRTTTGSEDTFVLTGADDYGRTITLDPDQPETVTVHQDGLLLQEDVGLAPFGDYTVDAATSTVTLATPAAADTVIIIDAYINPNKLAPGAVKTAGLADWVPDGSTVTFDLRAAGSLDPITPTSAYEIIVHVDGLRLRPEVDYTVSGSQMTLSEAPLADSDFWGTYFFPFPS